MFQVITASPLWPASMAAMTAWPMELLASAGGHSQQLDRNVLRACPPAFSTDTVTGTAVFSRGKAGSGRMPAEETTRSAIGTGESVEEGPVVVLVELRDGLRAIQDDVEALGASRGSVSVP